MRRVSETEKCRELAAAEAEFDAMMAKRHEIIDKIVQHNMYTMSLPQLRRVLSVLEEGE